MVNVFSSLVTRHEHRPVFSDRPYLTILTVCSLSSYEIFAHEIARRLWLCRNRWVEQIKVCTLKITAFWDKVPCSLVEVNRRFMTLMMVLVLYPSLSVLCNPLFTTRPTFSCSICRQDIQQKDQWRSKIKVRHTSCISLGSCCLTFFHSARMPACPPTPHSDWNLGASPRCLCVKLK
jgi:hypothetical protein